jgi:hypothetical protein
MEQFEEFQELDGTGFESKEPVKPEDEFFHSVYIAGVQRKNHIQIEEQIGKLQIRGVEYNLNEINMIITVIKDVLAKTKTVGRKESLECFSYKQGESPWFGTSKLEGGSPRQCGNTSVERAANAFCSDCRSQILVSGIYCKPDGTPILNQENKPTFVFLRAKGMKYSGISEYLNELFKLDLEPIFVPETEQTRKFEKSVVNNKRFVTKISVIEVPSNYGPRKVFKLDKGAELPKKTVLEILKISKKLLPKFEEKFDWSKGKFQQQQKPKQSEGIMTFESSPTGTLEAKVNNTEEKNKEPFDFSQLGMEY